MSECVVRMEMPKSCEGCWLPSSRCKWRTLSWYLKDDSTVSYRNSRSPFCPIICSLPEGHGRLVDADALNRKKKHLIKTENGVFPKSEWFIKANDLFAAKTIVPAERSET